MMKKIFTLIILLPLIGVFMVNAQRKPSKSTKRKMRLITRPLPQPKVETEDWKSFESAALKFRVDLPKVPTISENEIYEDFTKAKSTVHQSYINQIFYLVEVREYPEGFLPNRSDLSLNYGTWMKEYILDDVKVHSERVFDFGGNLAVEFIYQQTKNDLLIHRAYVVGQKLFQQIIQIEIKKPDNLEQTIEKNKDRINKFLDSFTLTEDQTNDSLVG